MACPRRTPARTPRRSFLQAAAAAALMPCLVPWLAVPGCATSTAEGGGAAPPREPVLLRRARSVAGGFLVPPQPGAGRPAPVANGMYVKLIRPAALALRGMDALVHDEATQRLWRLDLALGTLSAVAGAPTGPGLALALGADGSAWVLDAQARQVLRFGRDGRLWQSFRIDQAMPTPAGLALADGGTTLLLADGLGAQWTEQRGPGATLRSVRPARADGQRVSGVDGLALAPSGGLWLLDRLAGAVHLADRDGRVQLTLGQGQLMQPQALAADAQGRVFVVDRQGHTLCCLQAGAEAQRFEAAALGAGQIGGLAIDGTQLALSDAQSGQLLMFRLGAPGSSGLR
jgi:sugar lactone lactonase YvrE